MGTVSVYLSFFLINTHFNAPLVKYSYCNIYLTMLKLNETPWIREERDWHMWRNSSRAPLVQSDLVRNKHLRCRACLPSACSSHHLGARGWATTRVKRCITFHSMLFCHSHLQASQWKIAFLCHWLESVTVICQTESWKLLHSLPMAAVAAHCMPTTWRIVNAGTQTEVKTRWDGARQISVSL